jgi:hypothetical protein
LDLNYGSSDCRTPCADYYGMLAAANRARDRFFKAAIFIRIFPRAAATSKAGNSAFKTWNLE